MAEIPPLTVTPVVTVAPEPVKRGLQTWIGYGTTAVGYLAVVVLALLQAADAGSIDLPPWLYGLLVSLATLAGMVTGKNRSDQAVAKEQKAAAVTQAIAAAPAAVVKVETESATTQAPAPPRWVAPAEPDDEPDPDPGQLDADDLPDELAAESPAEG